MTSYSGDVTRDFFRRKLLDLEKTRADFRRSSRVISFIYLTSVATFTIGYIDRNFLPADPDRIAFSPMAFVVSGGMIMLLMLLMLELFRQEFYFAKRMEEAARMLDFENRTKRLSWASKLRRIFQLVRT